jgi:hypothetical protein
MNFSKKSETTIWFNDYGYLNSRTFDHDIITTTSINLISNYINTRFFVCKEEFRNQISVNNDGN